MIGVLRVLTHCMLGNISWFCCCLLTFFKINFFKKFFHKHYQSVKKFGSRSGPTICWSWSGSKLFAKVISRRQKALRARNELGPNRYEAIKVSSAADDILKFQIFFSIQVMLDTSCDLSARRRFKWNIKLFLTEIYQNVLTAAVLINLLHTWIHRFR